MLLLELSVTVLTSDTARLRSGVLVLVDLRERLLGLGVLKFEEPRWQEWLVVHWSFPYNVVELVVENTRLDALLQTVDHVLRDDRDGFHEALELQVLFEERILRSCP